jgi:hypothetical protein
VLICFQMFSKSNPNQRFSKYLLNDYSVGSNSNYGLGVALSLGGGKMGSYLYFTFANSCNRPGVHFVDITGDGR